MERIESTKKLRSDNTSGYTGVQNDHERWRATITFKKKHYYLGTYDKLEQGVRLDNRQIKGCSGSSLTAITPSIRRKIQIGVMNIKEVNIP